MIDISQYTNQIASAIYGRDVRQSIVDGLTACANTAGLEVLGSYASLAELQAAHPTGNTGDYYIAGLDLYYWNGKAWEDVSQFTGVGITGISKTSTSVLNDTYTITYSDGTTSTFTVTNGNGIESFAKTSTSGLVDTYTITFTNGSTQAVEITNGKGIQSIAKTSTAGLVDTYTITFTDSTTQTFTVTNGYTPTLAVHQNADMSVTVTLTDQSGTTTVTIPASSYTLPVATATTLGGVKIGTGVSATADGTLSADVTSVNGNTGAVTVTDITGNAATATTATDYAASGGIATALAGKQATLTFDSTPTSGSMNPVTSGGVFTSLATKAGLSLEAQTITLAASSWDSTAHTITVSVTGVTATSNQDILPLLATSTANITNNTNLASAGIYDYGQSAGTITLYATTVPTADLQIRVIVRGD